MRVNAGEIGCYPTGMVRRLLSLLLCISMPVALVAQTPAAADDRAAVRAVVETYLHGLRFNDVDSLKQAFWPDARLFFTQSDGSLGQLTQAEWHAGFAQSAGQEAKAQFKIASLEVTNDAAAVKVVETYPRSRYTDYLSLIRIGGKWQIVNNIYTAQKLDVK